LAPLWFPVVPHSTTHLMGGVIYIHAPLGTK
jgi:hypothetical protein